MGHPEFFDDEYRHREVGSAILSCFEIPDVALVGGPSLPDYGGQPPEWLVEFWDSTPYGGRWCGYLSLLDFGVSPFNFAAVYLGAELLYSETILRELGGFHPDCIPARLQHYQGDGETGLSIKAELHGLKSVYEPGASVQHSIPAERLTIEYFEKRAYYQGVCELIHKSTPVTRLVWSAATVGSGGRQEAAQPPS